MHELSIAHEILRIVEAERRDHGFDRVVAVRVRAGALSGIDRGALEMALEAITPGTCAEGARVELDVEDRLLTCRDCGARIGGEIPPRVCPECGSPDLALSGATDLEIVSLEVE